MFYIGLNEKKIQRMLIVQVDILTAGWMWQYLWFTCAEGSMDIVSSTSGLTFIIFFFYYSEPHN